MNTDGESLIKFKRSALAHLFQTDANTSRILFMVCAKYGAEIVFLASNDENTKDLLTHLTPENGDYYVWAVFEDNAEARAYYDKVRSIDVSPYIPRDPKQVKAER